MQGLCKDCVTGIPESNGHLSLEKMPLKGDGKVLLSITFCLPLLLLFSEIRSFAIVDYEKRATFG